MYSQFFGNYLLSKGAVTDDQLVRAMLRQHDSHTRLGALAQRAGYMTAEDVRNIIICQTHEDKLFGELARKEGCLTEEQLVSLLASQTPDYLLLGQALIDDHIMSRMEFDRLVEGYRSENAISHGSPMAEKQNLKTLIRNLFQNTMAEMPDYLVRYLDLLINNLIRFIGEDFAPMDPQHGVQHQASCCSSQTIGGVYPITSYLDMKECTAIQFASRYMEDSFTEFDEYVQDSVQDFLNLHNGLFNVNISNEQSVELELDPPSNLEHAWIHSAEDAVKLPIIYPFGVINFLVKL